MRHPHPVKEHLLIFAPALLIIFAGFILAYQFIKPAPPTQIRIATGEPDGAYHQFARRYARFLDQEGISLELVPSSGSIDNIRLLESGSVDIAFVQSGVADAGSAERLRALGSLYFEPVWLFYRDHLRLTRLTELAGRSIAIGPIGSGTRALAMQLLRDNGLDESSGQFQDLSGRQAQEALQNGTIDAAFFIASARSTIVKELLAAERIRLLDFARAEAYTRLHRHLSTVTLPEGVIDMQHNIPPRQTRLLAASASLVATPDLHPALIDLLLQAAQAIHGEGGWFESTGQFPSADHLDFPLLQEAERFYQYGPPFLQRYLPFWAATLIDRLKVMLLPLLALMLPLIRIMPPIYRWRMRSRIYRWYRDILSVERQLLEEGITQEQARRTLLQVEQEVSRLSVPLSFADELYDLRLHIGLVRERLNRAPVPG